MGQSGGVGHSRPRKRNERQHVERADARMEPAMGAQVDSLGGQPCQGDTRGDNLIAAAHDGEDAAVMGGVETAIEQLGPGRRDDGGGGVEERRVAPLGEIRYDFKQRHRRRKPTRGLCESPERHR